MIRTSHESERHSVSESFQPLLVEGIARVVSIQDNQVWFEPEQTTSCGTCVASGLCSPKEIGTLASKLMLRRFVVNHHDQFSIGERVVVGVSELALVRAALVAYGIPLLFALVTGIITQWLIGLDAVTLMASGLGLGGGLLISYYRARRLERQGKLALKILRVANPGESCKDFS